MAERGRTWIGVLNNPQTKDIDPETYLSDWFVKHKAQYVIGQLEEGDEKHTPHIQYALWFKQPVRKSALISKCKYASYKLVGQDNGVDNYSMKEHGRLDGPWSFGTKPVKRNSATDWEEVKQNAISGNLEAVPADIYIRHYHTLKHIAKDHLVPVKRTVPRKCYWYWGETGTGKSKAAFALSEDPYPKSQNKWWDGYKGEKTVILDEFDEEHKMLGPFLKKWSDPWVPFIGEAKGGAISPDYDVFVVTSNYSLQDLFGDKPQILGPLLRRFEVHHFNHPLTTDPPTPVVQ